MRDRTLWQEDLIAELRLHLAGEPNPKTAASRLCEVELGLYLMEELLPGHPAEAGWTLLGGYPFASGHVRTPDHLRMMRIGRHLLWPLRRSRSWQQALDAYRRLAPELRGYRLEDNSHVPQRLAPSIAFHRWATYAQALHAPPPFLTRALTLAEPGQWKFLQDRMWTSVDMPDDLPIAEAEPHLLDAAMPGGGKPLEVDWDELAATASWMDAELARHDLPPSTWTQRFARIRPYLRNPDGSDFTESQAITLDRMCHIVGMVGAGKSTLRDVLATWAARRGLRCTLVVGDVAEVLSLVELFTSLGLAAAPILGASTRERHIQRLHRRLASQGTASLLAHDAPGFDYLSTACALDALRGVEAAEPLPFSQAPCTRLLPAGAASSRRRLSALAPDDGDHAAAGQRGRRHGCPLWTRCPRYHASRELTAADIWIATPASLVHSAVPAHQNAERIRYLELACRRSDLIVVDEADRVQMQLDIMFAPATTLVGRAPNSWLDEVQQHKIEELARSGRIQLSDADVMRWTAATNSVSTATDRIYAMLLQHSDLRRWVEADYFSAWTLQHKLVSQWFGQDRSGGDPDPADTLDRPDPEWDEDTGRDEADDDPGDLSGGDAQVLAGRRNDVMAILDAFRDDPLGDAPAPRPEVEALVRLTRQLLHTTRTRYVRHLVREQLLALSARPNPAACDHPARAADRQASQELAQQSLQFEFTLLLAVLHERLDLMTEMWPRVEAALNLAASSNVLSRRPPEDYRPLVPESPMGNILGFQFQSEDTSSRELHSGELRFFRCAGSGRELLLQLPDLTDADGLPAPHVVLMSGTSWAGTSTRYHVLAQVDAILKPPWEELDAIAASTFSTRFLKDPSGKPLKLSGAKPHLRPLVLEQMLSQLARRAADGKPSPLEQELAAITDERRRRLLLLTGSYDEARRATSFLDTIPRWAGKVCHLISDDAEQEHLWQQSTSQGTRALRRGDVATFAESGAEILVAPLLAIERGHNILFNGVAAIGAVFFLARPHPRPDDIGLAIQAINDWAARMQRDGSFEDLVRSQPGLAAAGAEFRHLARAQWRHLLNRQVAWRWLNPEEKISFTWDQLVVIWQVIGRLVRGGVPARVVFVDAPFAERRASDLDGDTWKTSLLLAMRHVLDPYFSEDPGAVLPISGSPVPALDRELVGTLYQPLHAALSRLFPLTGD